MVERVSLQVSITAHRGRGRIDTLPLRMSFCSVPEISSSPELPLFFVHDQVHGQSTLAAPEGDCRREDLHIWRFPLPDFALLRVGGVEHFFGAALQDNERPPPGAFFFFSSVRGEAGEHSRS